MYFKKPRGKNRAKLQKSANICNDKYSITVIFNNNTAFLMLIDKKRD